MLLKSRLILFARPHNKELIAFSSLCEHCQCTLTVRHILVECNHFAQERKDIFGGYIIVLFLKQTEFYYKF